MLSHRSPVLRHLRVSALRVLLTLLVAGFVLDASAEEIKIGGTGGALGAMELLATAFARQHPDVKVSVLPSLGSGGGIKAAIQGAIDIGVSARPLNADELKTGARQVEYARTVFVFAVSIRSGVRSITLDQLADIYANRVQTWPDGTPIRLVMRPIVDIDSEQIKKMSPKLRQAKAEAEKRPGMVFAVTDQDAANDIERIPGAIGPTTLGLIISENRDLRALTLDGVEPSPKSGASGAYRYSRSLFLVTGARRSPAANRFIDFVRSAAGRDILVRAGHWIP